jgi:radical SAM protein with 4Fe4S-binding SPASM domain
MLNFKNFCAAPFKELVIDTDGTMTPCCHYKYPPPRWTSENKFNNFDRYWNIELEPLRQDMLNNRHNDGCTYCKQKEAIPGQQHLRRFINGKYKTLFTPWELMRTDIDQPAIAEGTFLNDNKIENVEIRFGNYCNLKCIMCGTYASSSIADEYIKNKSTYEQHKFFGNDLKTVRWWEEPGALDKLYDVVKDARYIHFTGGEPMMIPEVVDILNRLDPAHVIKISFNTNMTKCSDKIFETFKKFKWVEIYASVEGVEEHNDYVRYGSKWSVIDSAIQRLREYTNVKLILMSVLQHTSVFTVPRLIEYANTNNLELLFSEVYHASGFGEGGYLVLDSVAPADIDKFRDYLTHHPNSTLHAWIDGYQFDTEKHARYREYVTMLDGIRGTNFQQIFSPSWS